MRRIQDGKSSSLRHSAAIHWNEDELRFMKLLVLDINGVNSLPHECLLGDFSLFFSLK